MASGLRLARFSCSRCGNCCRNHRVPLTHFDLSRLVESTRRQPDELVEWIASTELDMSGEPSSLALLPGGPAVMLLAVRDGACSLLSADESCTAHVARPMACRAYPLHASLGAKGGVRRLRVLRGIDCEISLDGPPALRAVGNDHTRLRRELEAHQRLLAEWNRRQRRRRRLGRALLPASELLRFLRVDQLGTRQSGCSLPSRARAAGQASSG